MHSRNRGKNNLENVKAKKSDNMELPRKTELDAEVHISKYLFRGISKQTGKFVYGDLLQNHRLNESRYILDDEGWYHKVDPQTVGMYIGITDRTDKEIYEGDIVKESFGKWTGVVRYNRKKAQFVRQNTYCSAAVNPTVEITGNIHEMKMDG